MNRHPQLDESTPFLSINREERDGGPVNSLFRYYFDEEGNSVSFGKSQATLLAVQLLGATAGIYAWPPAKSASSGKPLWMQISIQATNPGSSVLFLMNATADLFSQIEREFITPQAIRSLLSPPTRSYLISKYTKMAIGSAICAVPFGILTYFFPLPGCVSTTCLALISAHSWLSNLIMHALAWGFILTPNFWYYRIPIIPLERLVTFIKNFRKNDNEYRREKKNEELELIYNKYRSKIASSAVLSASNWIEAYLSGKINTQDFKNLDFSSFLTINKDFSSRQKALPFETLVKIIGGLWIMIGITGWIVSPFYLGQKVLHLATVPTIFFGALPAYTTMVLSSFFGALILPKIYSYLFSGGDWKSKLSFEARMYPMTFTLAVALDAYVSAFAYANGVEYIQSTHFDDPVWDAISPILQCIAIPALILLSFVPLLDLINTLIRAVATYAPSINPDKKEASKLLTKASLFAGRVTQLNGRAMMSDLRDNYTSHERNEMGIEELEFSEDNERLKSFYSASFSN